METWRVALEEMQAWLARRGCRFLVVLACDKYLIYPEVLPRGLARTAGPFRIEQFATHLRRYSTVPVVGLLDPLLAARKKERIYHRTDSHWNDRGAYVGYAEIMNRLAKWDPRLRPNPTSAFERVEADTTGWDIPKLMKLADRIHEEDRRLVPRDGWQAKATVTDPPDDRWNCARIVMERGDKALPRLLVFRDSFGSALVPFLSEHFRYAEFMWQYEFDPRIVERARPDAVIFEIASRRLQWYVPENPPLP
jgi:hypothetical protein